MRHAALLLLILAGCAKQPDPQSIADKARSWRATIEVSGAMMRERKIPRRYVKQVAAAAEEELMKEQSDDAQTRAALLAARTLRARCESR